ncbi:unnamed protein product [Musa acuminata subsp. burmannicoides]
MCCPSSPPQSFIRRRRCRGYSRSHILWEEWKMSTCLMTLVTFTLCYQKWAYFCRRCTSLMDGFGFFMFFRRGWMWLCG